MILKLKNSDPGVANKIWNIFQNSYAVEAELLQAVDFPPLKRLVSNFAACTNEFFGYLIDNEPVAVVEIDAHPDHVHIQSLVILPDYFRRGIASALIRFVFDSYGDRLYTVETGQKNRPAITLYENFGFVKTIQKNTDHGILKVRYEIRINNSEEV